MQTSMNDSLVTLLSPEVQAAPLFKFNPNDSTLTCKLWRTDHDPNARLHNKSSEKRKIRKYRIPAPLQCAAGPPQEASSATRASEQGVTTAASVSGVTGALSISKASS